MAYPYPYTGVPYGQTIQNPVLPQVAPAPAGNGLNWVQGENGAKSFLVAPGNTVLLMDSEAKRFYLKSADNSGMPQPLRVFEYTEISGNGPDMNQYVTRDELKKALEALKGEEHA